MLHLPKGTAIITERHRPPARACRPWLIELASAVLLAGCHGGAPGTRNVTVISDAAAPLSSPAHAPVAASRLLRAATTAGLVALDREGRVTPALADRWIVTDDGLGYIFRLRDTTWPDGTAVTGDSARLALRQALDAIAGTPLARDLAGITEIKAMAGRVIEIRLAQPIPDVLRLLAQSELGLSHRGRGWGPMSLSHAPGATLLTPIAPDKRKLAPGDPILAGRDRLRLVTQPAARALMAFKRGETDVVLGGGFADLPHLAPVGLSRFAVRVDPVSGLFGLLVVRAQGLLATPGGREAIAMVIDRDSLATGFASAGWVPSTRIVTPNPADLAKGPDDTAPPERWAALDLEARRALAGKRVAQARASARAALTIHIALPPGPGADILFERLLSDFAAIDVTLMRAGPGKPADLVLIDRVASYAGSAWFLNQLSCMTLGNPCVPAADALAARARVASDPARATALWAEAKATLTSSNLYIPLGPPVRWSLSREGVAGFAINRWGEHPLSMLAMRSR